MSRAVGIRFVHVLALVMLGGCPPVRRDDTAGPKKDPIVDGTGDPDTVAKGAWCCRSCSSTADVLSCSGCTATPGTTTACTKAGETVLVDCPGRTTFDGGNVVCY
jgi:uncharacterized protein YceK